MQRDEPGRIKNGQQPHHRLAAHGHDLAKDRQLLKCICSNMYTCLRDYVSTCWNIYITIAVEALGKAVGTAHTSSIRVLAAKNPVNHGRPLRTGAHDQNQCLNSSYCETGSGGHWRDAWISTRIQTISSTTS